jgi:hypothetical protein
MAGMSEALLLQGRCLQPADIAWTRQLIAGNPGWSRRRISEAMASAWDWRNRSGQLKDMAARSLLLKLEARGLIRLPARRQTPGNRMARIPVWDADCDTSPVVGSLQELGPLTIQEVSADGTMHHRCAAALARFHYLGWSGAVGENLQYTICNEAGRLLSCIAFGSAAWKCRARDEFIGWSAVAKQQQLHQVTNNSRFLILPFVQVPHLASWILSHVLGRLSADWEAKYGHRIVLVETFVDRERFRGTCYRAANWIHTGATAGRSRQDRGHTLQVPVKDVYVYPLRRKFRQELSA